MRSPRREDQLRAKRDIAIENHNWGQNGSTHLNYVNWTIKLTISTNLRVWKCSIEGIKKGIYEIWAAKTRGNGHWKCKNSLGHGRELELFDSVTDCPLPSSPSLSFSCSGYYFPQWHPCFFPVLELFEMHQNRRVFSSFWLQKAPFIMNYPNSGPFPFLHSNMRAVGASFMIRMKKCTDPDVKREKAER